MTIYIYKLLFFITFFLNTFYAKTQNYIKMVSSEGNFAYVGVYNSFEFKTDVYKDENLFFKCSVGKIEINNGEYIYKALKADSTIFFVYKVSNSDTVLIHQQTIKIRTIPDPSIAIQGRELKSEINKSLLTSSNKLDGFLDVDNSLKNSFDVVSFEIKFVSNNKNIILKSDNNNFTNEMKVTFLLLNSGNKIIFDKILLSGPDGSVRYLGHDVPLIIK